MGGGISSGSGATGVRAGFVVAGGTPIAGTATGMNKGGGHAVIHLRDAGLIPNKGSLASQVQVLQNIARPILENPTVTFNWKVGATQSRGFAGELNGQKIVILVAKDGPWQGKVLNAFIPDANQMKLMGIK